MIPADLTIPPPRLHGLDAGQVMDLAMQEETGGARDIPTAAELGALLPDFAVEAVIGRGGMGAVYRAVQRKLERPVAIKVLPVELGDAPGFADRFRREAMTTAGLAHPDIVAVFDTGETVAGHLYYVMDLVDGEDLALRMARGRMSVEESVALLTTVCGAVEAAHARGIVHRDIKPSNILLTKEGKPKLADFGLALLTEKHLEYSRLTLGGTTLGTLEYAAPEQLAGAGVSLASDQYSLGVLAYELLTGELPRGVFDPPSARRADINPAFDGVVLRALQSDPPRRYASVAEFRAAILSAADRRVQQENRERALRRKVARRARAAVFFLIIAVLTAGSALYAWFAKREAGERHAEALQAGAKTDDLIQFLLTDLRRRLEPTGNLGAMESVLERAVAHYREKYAAAGRSPESALQLADVLTVKADVIEARGLYPEAESHYTEALALTESARKAAPEEEGRLLRVARALKRRSEFYMARGRLAEARDDAQRMLAEAQHAERLTGSETAQHAEAQAHIALANAFGYSHMPEKCRVEYLEAQKIYAGLLKTHPGEARLKYDLASLESSLGSLDEDVHDYPEMLRHFTAYHDYIKERVGTNDIGYSYSAFRMGVAMLKCERPAEAVPFMTDAVRLAQGEADAKPGDKNALHHLAACLDVMVQALEGSGQTARAVEFRAREEKVSAEKSKIPAEAAVQEEREFARLCASEFPHSEWWALCQELQTKGEGEPILATRRKFYEAWLERAMESAAGRPAGDFRNTLVAFMHNRLAAGWLKEDAAISAQHAVKALDLRQAMATAHPGDSALERNVLSSAEHLVEATVNGNSAEDSLEAFTRFATAAQGMSVTALLEKDQATTFAHNAVSLLDFAAKRWPGSRADFATAGAGIAAALFDRLPEDKRSAAAELRERLSRSGRPP